MKRNGKEVKGMGSWIREDILLEFEDVCRLRGRSSGEGGLENAKERQCLWSKAQEAGGKEWTGSSGKGEERTGAGISWVQSARCYINTSLHPLIPL